MSEEIKISPYVVRFSLAYAVALIAIALILTVLNLDSNSGTSMAALFTAVVFTIAKFVKDQKRVPTLSERKKLTWLSLMASFAVSLVLAVGVIALTGQLSLIAQLPSVLEQLGGLMVVGAFVFITAIYSLTLWFSYGWFAKAQYRAMEKKGEL